MTNFVYSDGFEKFWKQFRIYSPSQKGSKLEAFKVWESMKLESFADEICDGCRIHASNDNFFKSKGEFVASWKHACRWLANRCWDVDDEAEIVREKKILARSAKIQEERDRDRQAYKRWLSEQSDEDAEKWVEKWCGSKDWLLAEIRQERIEK